MNKVKVITYSVLFFATAFGLVSFLFYFKDWQRLLLVVLMGIFVGLLAAPELNPKVFKHASVFQLLSGAAAGSILGFLYGGSIQAAVVGFMVGGILGFTANYWVKHVPIP